MKVANVLMELLGKGVNKKGTEHFFQQYTLFVNTQMKSQIKGTAAYIKQGNVKEVKICLVDPKTDEVKEVYKFSQKTLAEENAEIINPKLKQKRLLEMIEGNV